MHTKIDEIKKTESAPRVIKKLFSKIEIDKFIELYQELPTTVHNKKQNVIKKRWLIEYGIELEKLFYEKLSNEIGNFEYDNLKTDKGDKIDAAKALADLAQASAQIKMIESLRKKRK